MRFEGLGTAELGQGADGAENGPTSVKGYCEWVDGAAGVVADDFFVGHGREGEVGVRRREDQSENSWQIEK